MLGDAITENGKWKEISPVISATLDSGTIYVSLFERMAS